MDHISDDDLRRLTAALAAVVGAGGWHEPPRLYGLLPRHTAPFFPRTAARSRSGALHAGGRRWLRLAEGDPYAFLDTVRVSERDASALALVVCGWATTLPFGPRSRMRSVVMVTPDRRQCTALERRDDPGGRVIDDRGEGPMLRALLSAWITDQLAGPPPAA